MRVSNKEISEKIYAMEELIDSVFRLSNGIKRIEKRIHTPIDDTTVKEREFLFALFSGGPETVPRLANQRSVSRQNVQQTMNSLEVKKLLERRENPTHKKSMKYSVTAKGRQIVLRMIRRERRLFKEILVEFATGKIRSSAKVLEAISKNLEGQKFNGK